MRLIVNADPVDIPAVVEMVLREAHWFDDRPERLGWGWHWVVNGRSYFVRQIKGGLSASPSREKSDG